MTNNFGLEGQVRIWIRIRIKTAHNRRFGNMAGRRIYAHLSVRYSASVPADE